MKILKEHIAHLTMFIGTIAILSVIAVSPHDIPIGEIAYQEWCLGRMAMLFAVCGSLSLLLDRKGDKFYPSVVWGLILLGGLEAIWGLKQIYGLSLSNHSLYTVTGSFYNPGPYSGYLAMVLPVCLSEWLLLKKETDRNWIEQGKYYTAGGVLILILCILPVGMSRSAWIAATISGIWVYGIHDSWGSRLKEVCKKYKKRTFLIATVGSITLVIAGSALFHLKENSANGRLLMWKVSSIALAEKPFTGYGTGNFALAYGMAQESYFAGENDKEREELVAGSPEYAFNEYLQVAIEHGVLFLLFVLLFIVFCLWKGFSDRHFSACGGVISVLIFAFSSYPMQIPAFAMAFFFLLTACIVRHSRIITGIFILMIGLAGGYYFKCNRYEACRSWNECKILYNIGACASAKEDYEKLYPALRNRGTFLYEYGHCLHKLREYDASNKILNEAEKYSCDPMILNIIAKNFQAKKDYAKAEKWLIRSTHRLPGRIYPYYLLAKLYAEPEFRHPEKLQLAVETVLTKTPKVQSTAIREMREEVKKLVKSKKQDIE